MRILHAVALAALAVSTGAAAQLFKCKGPDGKIVYSDTRCEAAHSGEALKVSPNSTTGGPRQDSSAPIPPPPPRSDAAALPEEAGAAAGPAPRRRYELTSSDRDRIRNLEVTANSLGASREQKSAAELEMQSIKNGAESRLSPGDRAKRESLTTDLASADAKKRGQALRELREIYYH